MSPIFFAIFLNDLGRELNRSGLGINIGNINIAAVFFADDLVLVGKTRKALHKLMKIARRYFKNHFLVISESKSKVMSHDASTGEEQFDETEDIPLITLEKVCSFNYLGIPLNVAPYCLFRDFNERIKRKANNYLHAVLALARNGPDRSELARALWLNCALPSILFGCEVIPINQGTINEVERCQSLVGKFVLQIPKNSANVCANIDAGFKPVRHVVDEKVLLYSHRIMQMSPDVWTKKAMEEIITLGDCSSYYRNLLKIKSKYNSFGMSRSQIKDAVYHSAVHHVLKEQEVASISTFAMSKPGLGCKQKWFRMKTWINDSVKCKIFNEFRSCNTGLGNRGPTKDGQFFKLCPLCKSKNINAINNEVGTMAAEYLTPKSLEFKESYTLRIVIFI